MRAGSRSTRSIASILMDEAARAEGIDRAALVEKEITTKSAGGHRRGHRRLVSGEPGTCAGPIARQVRQPIRTFLTQERMQAVRDEVHRRR